jgi:hypothetical protein
MEPTPRGRTLTVFAVLFSVLAVSNLLKPFQLGAQTGFVLFGHRLTGTPNAVAGPLFGVYLLVYAVGIWGLRRWALPMGRAYAAYVIVNLIAFNLFAPKEPGIGFVIFGLVYAAVAIGVSSGAVYLLAQRKTELT